LDYTPGVNENENDSLYTFLVDIKEIYIEIVERHLDHAVHARLGSNSAAGVADLRGGFLNNERS
jgi:hypothetical protein